MIFTKLNDIFNTYSFKWKTGLCNMGRPYFCTARSPLCPPGYTWIAALGSSCFKITDQKGIQVGSDMVNAEPISNKMCAQEGTRLASVRTLEEKTGLLNWAFGAEQTNDVAVKRLNF